MLEKVPCTLHVHGRPISINLSCLPCCHPERSEGSGCFPRLSPVLPTRVVMLRCAQDDNGAGPSFRAHARLRLMPIGRPSRSSDSSLIHRYLFVILQPHILIAL